VLQGRRYIIMPGLFFCSLLQAETHLPAFATPAEQLAIAEAALETRLGYCRKFKTLRANYFDLWLQSQPFGHRRAILDELSRRAEERCLGSERKAYSDAQIRYAATSGDNAKLDQWVILYFDKPRIKKEPLPLPRSEYSTQFERLSSLPAYYMPFDLFRAVEAIAPLKEWAIDEVVDRVYDRHPYIQGLSVSHFP